VAAVPTWFEFEYMNITTQRLLLRPLQDSDVTELFEITSDPVAMQPWEHTFSLQQTAALLEKYKHRPEGQLLPLGWAVTRLEDGAWIGVVSLQMVATELEDMQEIGYLQQRKHWGHGYISEAAAAVCRYAFDTLGYSELCATIKIGNAASVGVARRLGMQLRGSFVRNYNGKDMPHETYILQKHQLP